MATATLEARTYTPTKHELDMLDLELAKMQDGKRVDYMLGQDIFGVKKMIALLHRYDSSNRIETPIGRELILALYAHVMPEMQKPDDKRLISNADAAYVRITFSQKVMNAKKPIDS